MDEYMFRKSYLTMSAGALFFAACGAVIFFMDLEAGDGGRRSAWLSSVPFAKEVLLFFCAGFVGICVFAFFSGRPKLTAGREGLVFTGMFGKVFRLRWQDIKAVDVAKQYMTLHHVSNGKMTKTNIGGMFKMKPPKMLDKMNDLTGGTLLGRT
ncbi:MAG: hypothetical protein AAGB16_03240 [Pseudomonadota bacterium]